MGLVGQEIHYRRLLDKSIDHEDLKQEGRLGLWEAIKKFDLNRSYKNKQGKRCYYKFSTYAWYRVRMRVGRYLEEQRMIHLPSGRQEKLTRLFMASTELSSLLCREPTLSELEEEMGIPESEIEELLKYPRILFSLDTPLRPFDEDDTTVMGDTIPDPCSTKYQPRIVERQWLERLLKMLPEDEREVIVDRFDWNERGEEETFRALGRRYGISFEGVRDRQKRALRRLKRYYRIFSQMDENALAEEKR